ncbi:MAG: nucleotidyltransferase family protein [Accumulibacter sp.]|jgi:predicted nucleotidyltransferase|uniref:nucleotidyltransferase family protein n=1 Tax=Accumulibacter sp. TaxID=2053492 RepID=UPI002FC274F6
MLTQERILELLRDQSTYLASEFGIRKMALFGSFAKGQPHAASDIDLIVEFERPIGLRFVVLMDYLEQLLGRKVDVLTPTGLENIRRKAVADSIAESLLHV